MKDPGYQTPVDEAAEQWAYEFESPEHRIKAKKAFKAGAKWALAFIVKETISEKRSAEEREQGNEDGKIQNPL